MDITDFKARLKSADISGVYIFAGEEDYLIRYYLKELRSAVAPDDAFALFNNPVFDGDEVDYSAIAEAVKSPPMMSDMKLIEWRHADFSSLKESELASLEELCSMIEDYSYCVLAFTVGDTLDFGTAKKPSAFVKRFGDKINLLRFERSGENQLYAWLKRHFEALGVKVGLDTVKELVFRSGRSMDVLAGEVEKLAALALARGKDFVTVEDVTEVASSTPECDTFALSNAILERNKQKAFDALEELKIRRIDPAVTMGMIARVLNDLTAVAQLMDDGMGVEGVRAVMGMQEYRLKLYMGGAKKYGARELDGIISELARVDVGSKYGGVAGYTAIELFISRFI